MDTNSPDGAQTLERALLLFEAIVRQEGRQSIGVCAQSIGIPRSTAHRYVVCFERHGLLTRIGKGRYAAGMAIASFNEKEVLKRALSGPARASLRKLSRQLNRTLHLGVLEEDMVTYIVKETANPDAIFTREGMQLEAYCSGVGKVLLAHLPEAARDNYLASGPFIALTATTIIDPDHIRAGLAEIRDRGFAQDCAEVAHNVHCIAVPIRDRRGHVCAAISASHADIDDNNQDRVLSALLGWAEGISRHL